MRLFRKQIRFTEEENSAIKIISEIYVKTINTKIDKCDTDLKVKAILESIVKKVDNHKNIIKN